MLPAFAASNAPQQLSWAHLVKLVVKDSLKHDFYSRGKNTVGCAIVVSINGRLLGRKTIFKIN